MGIALLPVAAGSSSLLEAMHGRTILPEGVLMVARAAKQLLEAAEDCIFFKKKVWGGVWFGLVSVKKCVRLPCPLRIQHPLK